VFAAPEKDLFLLLQRIIERPMMDKTELDDLLDRYAKGELPAAEVEQFHKKMKADPNFSAEAEEHVRIVEALRLYGDREALRKTLAGTALDMNDPEFHGDEPMIGEWDIEEPTKKKSGVVRRYWPMVAVAASVALFSILGTLMMTQSMEKKQTAYYKELRRNVEQIQKSQSRLLADIAKTNEKPAPQPGRYAGSGFLVSANGYVITSQHVVVGADSVYIENPAFGRLKTSVVLSDPTNDLAVLRIESPDFKLSSRLGFTVSDDEANLGEEVFTLGFPRDDIVFGEGAISAHSGYRQNPNAYQVSVPVNPGNSGGPLFNEKGELVGIISGIQTETSGAAFAIKSTVLLDVIGAIPVDSVHAPLVLPKQNHMRYLPRVEQIKKWKDHVFVVRVYNNK
jgi:serine protease Do